MSTSARQPVSAVAPDAAVDAGSEARALMQIGDVAEQAGLSLRTVRYYDEVGLLPAERSPGGFRLYDRPAVERLLVIKQMKPLEFTLEEMRELLDALDELPQAPPARRAELLDTLSGYRKLVDERIPKIEQRLRGALELRQTLDEL